MYGLFKSGGCLCCAQLVVVPPKLNSAHLLSALLSSCKICMKNEYVKVARYQTDLEFSLKALITYSFLKRLMLSYPTCEQ